MMLSREAILKVLARHREAIRLFGVRRLGLFGSRARGDSRETSDLDFLVEFENKTFAGYMDLKAFLEDIFRARVDLVTVEALRPGLKENILAETVYAAGL